MHSHEFRIRVVLEEQALGVRDSILIFHEIRSIYPLGNRISFGGGGGAGVRVNGIESSAGAPMAADWWLLWLIPSTETDTGVIVPMVLRCQVQWTGAGGGGGGGGGIILDVSGYKNNPTLSADWRRRWRLRSGILMTGPGGGGGGGIYWLSGETATWIGP